VDLEMTDRGNERKRRHWYLYICLPSVYDTDVVVQEACLRKQDREPG
jgi:hypothetical protein